MELAAIEKAGTKELHLGLKHLEKALREAKAAGVETVNTAAAAGVRTLIVAELARRGRYVERHSG